MPSSTERATKLESAVLSAVDEGAADAESILKTLIRTRSASGAEFPVCIKSAYSAD